MDRRTFLNGTIAAAALSTAFTQRLRRKNNQPNQQKRMRREKRSPFNGGYRFVMRWMCSSPVGGPPVWPRPWRPRVQGCRVFLAERQNCFGGMGTAALVPVFQNFGDGINLLVGGAGYDVLKRLQEAGGTGPTSSVTIRAEVLKRVYDQIVREAGVQFTFETQLIDIEAESDQIKMAILAAKSGLFAVKADYFIDCTGDGDLCAWAGAPYEQGDKDGNVMAGTLCSVWADIDWDAARKFGMGKQEALLPTAFKEHVFHKGGSSSARHVPCRRMSWGVGISAIRFGVDGTDERSVTEALVWGRQLLLEYERYYKEYLKGYEKYGIGHHRFGAGCPGDSPDHGGIRVKLERFQRTRCV